MHIFIAIVSSICLWGCLIFMYIHCLVLQFEEVDFLNVVSLMPSGLYFVDTNLCLLP